jgi:hypothetical protein
LVVFLRALADPDLHEHPLQLIEIAPQVAAERHISRGATSAGDDELEAGSRDLLCALSTLSASDREVLAKANPTLAHASTGNHSHRRADDRNAVFAKR